MTEQEKLAYFAGLLDGEGSFQLYYYKNNRGFPSFQSKMFIGNTDIKMIEWVHSNFGGYVFKVIRGKNEKTPEKWKDLFIWYKNLNQLEIPFLSSLLRLSITKKDRIELVIEYLKTKSSSSKPLKLTPEIIQKRLDLIDKIKLLNKRGKSLNEQNIINPIIDDNSTS